MSYITGKMFFMHDGPRAENSGIQYIEHPLIRNNCLEIRNYQNNIADAARMRNTIVILPTALGKTVISLLVAADILYSYRDKRVLFLAPTKPLIAQHLNFFSSNLKIPREQMTLITGKNSPEGRMGIWSNDDLRLIFATPEVLKNDLDYGRVSLKNFALIVFDEAHRAVGDYAYTSIARRYIDQSLSPVILGLTASPGAENKRIHEVCNNLFVEHLEQRNEQDTDVSPYINPIEMKWMWLDLPQEYRYIASILAAMLKEKLEWLMLKGIIKKRSTEWIFKTDLIKAGEEIQYALQLAMEEERIPFYSALKNQSFALTLMYCLELIQSQGPYSLMMFLSRMSQEEGKGRYSLLNDSRILEIKTLLQNITIEHPKINHIIKLIKEQNSGYCTRTPLYITDSKHRSDNPQVSSISDSRILIFTQYRDTAQHVVDVLSRHNIRAYRFVGQSKKRGDVGMKQDEQIETIESFRKGTFNVLVATSVAEEGLDIPEVDLVVFYEPIASEIRYIQRRGRTGRKSAGTVVILATKDSIDERYLAANKRRIDKMKHSLKTLTRVLKPISRSTVKPNPMTMEEISDIELGMKKREYHLRKIFPTQSNKLQLSIPSMSGSQSKEQINIRSCNDKARSLSVNEGQTLSKEFKRQVDKAVRGIYSEAIRAGLNGLDYQMLIENTTFAYPVLSEAIKKLERLQKIAKLNEHKKIVAINTDDSDNTNRIALKCKSTRKYNVYIDKLMTGKALVTVDDKWHARLTQYDYEGPAQLLRKGSEFTAIGNLYRKDGVLNLRINSIV
jgi:ERCC4-related helicase